ncbi:MAG TPA: ABC transporter permease [Candidatus Koribacter sp.]|jgi:predicted permease
MKVREFFSRAFGSASKRQNEAEFSQQLAGDLALEVDRNLKNGMAPDEARRQAILKFGGLEQTRQGYREQSSLPFFEVLQQDVRFAVRQFAKNPAFAVTAIVVLTLGIAASAAIFAFVDAALLKPLPYRDPNRLVWVTEKVEAIPRANLSYYDYLDWKSRNQTLQSLDVWTSSGLLIDSPSGTEPVPGVSVSDGFFKTLGVTPMLGRDFRPGEDLPGAVPTVILSYGTWQKRFHGRPDIVGQTFTASGVVYTIIGVLPKSFQFAPRGNGEIWMTLRPTVGCELRRSCHDLNGIGRLKDGVTTAGALANFSSVAAQLEAQYPDSNRGQGASVEPLASVIVGDIRPILLLLLSGAALLLLIACVNVSSLLLVRFEGRRREIAVRGALGATRGRLVRQFLTEGVVLMAIALALGLTAAEIAIHALVHLISKDMLTRMPYLDGLTVNGHVVLFATATAVLAAALFAITPLSRLAANDELRNDLAEGGRGGSGMVWRRFASNLVVLELAIAVVLLAGAGLLGKSLYRLLHVQVGFDPEHLATLEIDAPHEVFPKDEDDARVARRVMQQVNALPGVESAAITSVLPVSYNGNTTWFRIVGRPYNGEHNEVLQRDVSANYFQTLRAHLVSGRYFTDDEDSTKPNVVIMNQALAKKYFPNEDPIGKQIGDNTLDPKSLAQIVGVVNDVKEGALDQDTWPALYFPYNQSTDSDFNLVVRTSQDAGSLLPTAVSAVRSVNPQLGASQPETMRQHIDGSNAAYLHRSSAWLVGGFAGLALLLGIVGLYGVIAYSVSQRTKEIGVRMALGAQRGAVYKLVLKEAGWLTISGVLVGVAGSIAAASLMGKLLFDVHAWDVPTLAAVALLLAAASLLASYLPARRAASVNPVEALRAE